MAKVLAAVGTGNMPTELESLLQRIDAYRYAESNWEPTDGQFVSDLTIANAKALLRLAAAEALQREITWRNPALGLDDDGRIGMTWRSGSHSAHLIVPDTTDQPNSVIAIQSHPGTKPSREVTSPSSAVEIVLKVLCSH